MKHIERYGRKHISGIYSFWIQSPFLSILLLSYLEPTEPKPQGNSGGDQGSSSIVPIAAGVGAAVAVIAILLAFVIYRMRR